MRDQISHLIQCDIVLNVICVGSIPAEFYIITSSCLNSSRGATPRQDLMRNGPKKQNMKR